MDDNLRPLTAAELKRRDAKLESMGPDGRAWLYDNEMKVRAEGADAWDRYLRENYGPKRAYVPVPKPKLGV